MAVETDQKLRSEILNLFQYVQRLREEIGRIAQQPEGQTRFEKMSDQLDAILISTGEATHTVLESLEAISSAAEEIRVMPDPAKVEELCDRITDKSVEGMEACSFQDLTGQRISKIIHSLRFIEERVEAMMEICGREGIEALVGELPSDEEDLKDGVALHGPQVPGEAVSQDEIDKLFS
jgi:chemotaxis protein CheZ